MVWPFGRSNRPRNPYNKYNDGPCINKYATIKNEVEQQIDDFEKTNHVHFYQEWDKLNKYIIKKDNELKECYKKGHVRTQLNDEEEIKKFRKKCNRDGTCNNGTSPAKKPPITKPPVQVTCKESKGCKNKTPESVDVKSKLVSGAANPHSSERNDSQEQGRNSAVEQKSRKISVIPQFQSGTTPSVGSVSTHGNASKEIVGQDSTTPGVLNTQKQQLNDSSPSGISELDRSSSDPFSECVSGRTSDLTCTLTEKILDTKGFQTSRNSGNPIVTNQSESQDSVSKIVEEETDSDKDITTKTAHNLSPNENTPDSLQRANEHSLTASTDGESPRAVVLDPEIADSEEDSSTSLDSSPSNDAGTNDITVVDIPTNYIAVDGEIKSVNVPHDDTHGSEDSCKGTNCNTTQNTEVTSDNNNDILGKLSYVFNVIQDNKNNMIKASIPMGIILLLTLLLKYTPLWRILTKKKRKEPVAINEELHSVLQEPSFLDEETSIPFSYSAFEYSS
ncbi:hypothetical protein PVBG_03310 [Plasmodium vivax Brazil I]|uniref:Variable surface protein Vir18 n=1 Tax=Plasmodium vivax (strain Brazil I) TaxID=1033975 RepID=A0A0J9T3A8_PLAV1|nr:hypothetical protein PVBG_03310 [Plasmodium vivax Brazil I]